MAQTTYISKVAVTTLARRAEAYDRARSLLGQLHVLNLNLVSIVVTAQNFVEVTVNNPLPAHKLDVWGIEAKV